MSTTKKGLLASGITVISTAIPMFVNGAHLEGGILAAIGIALVGAYDYLDDKMKGTPQLPDGVDDEFFVEVAEHLAENARDAELPDQLQHGGDENG